MDDSVYSYKQVLEATNALRDSLGASTDAVYGLTTLHACLNEALKKFKKPSEAISTYVFGLNGINKFVLRLPAQVLEEELPRIRPLILKVGFIRRQINLSSNYNLESGTR